MSVIIMKRTAMAVTLGVWIAAAGSAAALTYELNRPLSAPRTTSPVAAPSEAPPARLVEPASAEPATLYIPTITIVGHLRRPTAPAPKAEPAPKSVEGSSPTGP